MAKRPKSRLVFHPDETWSPWRVELAMMFQHWAFRALVTFVVSMNMLLVVLETNHVAKNGAPLGWHTTVSWFMLVFYIVECLGRSAICREEFFHDHLNTLDLVLVVIDVVSELTKFVMDSSHPSFTFLRIFRLMSMLTSVWVLMWFPELHLLVSSMLGAMRSIFWGTLVVSLWLSIWSIMAVVFINPLVQNLVLEKPDLFDGCTRCPLAFESVQASFLTFVQALVAGDSWGQATIPIIENHPWTMAFFLGSVATVQLGLLNLVLAVTVDRAQIARGEGDAAIIEVKKRERKELQGKMKSIFKDLDVDHSGFVTFNEIMKGMEVPMFRQAMEAMAIGDDDMEMIFKLLDSDRSGAIGYEEFADHLDKMKQDDLQTIVTFVRFYCQDIKHDIAEETKMMKTEIVDRLNDIELFLGVGKEAKKGAAGIFSVSAAGSPARKGDATPAKRPMNPAGQMLKSELEKLSKLQETIPRDKVKQLLNRFDEEESKAQREARKAQMQQPRDEGGGWGCCSSVGQPPAGNRDRMRA